MGFSDSESVPVRFGGRVCSRSLRGHSLLFEVVVCFVHPFPAAEPVIPPPVGGLSTFDQNTLCRRGPNHALQRTEAGGGVFYVFRVLRRQPPSLSLSSLGQQPFAGGFFEGESVLVPVAHGTPVPSSCQHTPVPARAVPSPRLSFGPASRSAHPFPTAAPSFPRRSRRPSFRRSRGPSVGGEPNHALQRTEAGHRASSEFPP